MVNNFQIVRFGNNMMNIERNNAKKSLTNSHRFQDLDFTSFDKLELNNTNKTQAISKTANQGHRSNHQSSK